MKIDESAEDAVILLSQFTGIGVSCLISTELLISSLKGVRLSVLTFGMWYFVVQYDYSLLAFSSLQELKSGQKSYQM